MPPFYLSFPISTQFFFLSHSFPFLFSPSPFIDFTIQIQSHTGTHTRLLILKCSHTQFTHSIYKPCYQTYTIFPFHVSAPLSLPVL